MISTAEDIPRLSICWEWQPIWHPLSYMVQPFPGWGLAQAFVLARNSLAKKPAPMVLGDNICLLAIGPWQAFAGRPSRCPTGRATVFGYYVITRTIRVVEFDATGKVLSWRKAQSA